MTDIAINEAGDGGDAAILGNDIATVDGLSNMPYMAWFSGNPKAVTTANELENEQREDWWGNSLLYENNLGIQYNSELEDFLSKVVLNSEGRVNIEEIAKKDLEFMRNFAEVEVEVFIVSNDRVEIVGKITEPNNASGSEFKFIWDNTKNEIIVQRTI